VTSLVPDVRLGLNRAVHAHVAGRPADVLCERHVGRVALRCARAPSRNEPRRRAARCPTQTG